MLDYKKTVEHFEQLIAKGGDLYKNISAENAARMDLQNRFKTGLDIANILRTSCTVSYTHLTLPTK